MTKEKEIKKAIKDYFQVRHIDYFHNLAGIGAYKGISDLVFFHPIIHNIIFLEVKTPKGELSEYQKKFRDMVEKHGYIYLVARSIDDIIEYCK